MTAEPEVLKIHRFRSFLSPDELVITVTIIKCAVHFILAKMFLNEAKHFIAPEEWLHSKEWL